MIPTTNDVRADIQMRIARFLEDTPERSLLLIPFDELEGFARLSPEGQATIITQLGGYLGVPMDTPELRIPRPYVLHPMVGSRQMEVIVMKEGFEDVPETFLAEDIVALVTEVTEGLDIGEEIDFEVPATFVELREEMKPSQQGRFRALIKDKLAARGLFIKEGFVTTALKLRRTK